jgi:hypothetical protein
VFVYRIQHVGASLCEVVIDIACDVIISMRHGSDV